jgi:hypothetical protein
VADQDCGGLAVACEHYTVVLVLYTVHQLRKMRLDGGEGQSFGHDHYLVIIAIGVKGPKRLLMEPSDQGATEMSNADRLPADWRRLV